MPLEKIVKVEGTGVYVAGDDLDTDRIIPARFMKCVTFDGLGQYLFYDARSGATGPAICHPVDDPRHKGATILVSGRNFGCGSSREHAPQAIRKFGFRAIIAESFAEIFAGNCTTLGMPCVQVAHDAIENIASALRQAPKTQFSIDLGASTVSWKCGQTQFQAALQMKAGAREALMKGEWDALAQLLDAREQVAALAAKLEYFSA
ncbi:MAG: 3-isopropylmalate dehydratase small subunit [Planctomycetota bacterium]|nr:3-isopropylmalate dehydratase small subunit [Planctomycetota bacterium]